MKSKTITLAKLRVVVRWLQEMLEPFTWMALSVKEVGEHDIYDPPCAMIFGAFGPLVIGMASDGELDVECLASSGECIFGPTVVVNVHAPPHDIAQEIITEISGMVSNDTRRVLAKLGDGGKR